MSAPSEARPDATALRERVATGLAWTGGSFGVLQLLGIVQTIVLARLLTPADFGVYGMVSLAVATLTTFTHLGIGEGVIQSRFDTRATLDSAFSLNLVRGALLYTVVFVAAPWIERFFGSEGLAVLLRVAALSILLGAASNVGPILFAKQLDYRRSTLWSHLSPLVSLLASLPLAWMLRSPWAFVLAGLTADALRLPLSYVVHPFRPRLRLEPQATRHLLRYGFFIMGSQPLFYLSNRIDDIVVGRMFGTAVLGTYQLAYNTAILPATHVGQIVLGVLFPLFAHLQSSPQALQSAILKALRHVANLSLPLSAFLFVFAGEFVDVFYGARWAAAVPLVMCFSIYGAARAIGTVQVEVLKATGHTAVFFRVAVLNLAAVVWVLFIAAPHGPVWIGLLVSAVSIPFVLYGFGIIHRHVGLGIAPMVKACAPGTVATAVASGIMLLALSLLDAIPYALGRLVAGGAGFGAVYLVFLLLLDRLWLAEIRSLVRAIAGPAEVR